MKKWYLSSTVWLGILTAIGGCADVLIQFINQHDFSLVGIAMAVSGLAAAANRFRTTTSIY